MNNGLRLKLLAVSLALAWLLPFHVEPLPSFYSEWLVAVGLLLACCLGLQEVAHHEAISAARCSRSVNVPASSLWLMPIVLVGALQAAMGRLAHPETALHTVAFVSAWMAASSLIARERDRSGLGPTLAPLAWGCSVASLLSLVAQVIQFSGWEASFDPWVFPLSSAEHGRPFGNIAQPNLVATLHGLGLASAGWLAWERRGPRILHAVVMLAAIMGMALSGSRTALLFFPLFALCVWLMPIQSARNRWILRAAGPMVMILLLILIRVGMAGLDGPSAALDRAGQFQSSERLVLWSVAWMAIAARPLLGHGVGSFSEAFFAHLTGQSVPLMPAHHAHNLFLQLGVEIGLAGLVVLLLGVGWHLMCLRGRLQRSHHLAFAAAIAGVLLVHSQLELPLWYLHFLLTLAWVCAALDPVRIRFRVPVPVSVRRTLTLLLLVGLLLAGKVGYDFQYASARLHRYFELGTRAQSGEAPVGLSAFGSLHRYLDHAWTPLPEVLESQDLERRRRATARRPFPQPLLKLIVAEHRFGSLEEAERLRRLYDLLYPKWGDLARDYLSRACTEYSDQGLCRLAQPQS